MRKQPFLKGLAYDFEQIVQRALEHAVPLNEAGRNEQRFDWHDLPKIDGPSARFLGYHDAAEARPASLLSGPSRFPTHGEH
jgi:hypothetical protein